MGKFFVGFLVLLVITIFLGGFEIVDTGNVGVKTTMGQINAEEVYPGMTTKLPIFTSITEYSVKESAFDLKNLTPKAKDNLSLKDLDVTVFYEVNPTKVADILINYQGQTPSYEGVWYPGRNIVVRVARESVYDAVSRMESLTIHQRRELLTVMIREHLQKKLDKIEPDMFKVNNIVIRAITTDPSIEESIRRNVRFQKELETKQIQIQTAKADAEIEITKARGVAQANQIINHSLTREYLQHEANLALMEFAKRGSNTVVVPANMQSAPLINVR